MNYQEQIFKTREAYNSFFDYSKVDDLLEYLAHRLETDKDELLAANQRDLDKMSVSDLRYERLHMTSYRIAGIAADIRNVVSQPSPLGKLFEHFVCSDDLEISKISVPLGVVGIVYEERPGLMFNAFALCIKSGNACILKGSSNAKYSNEAAVAIIKEALTRFDFNSSMITLLPTENEATTALLNARGYVDVVIPRGSQELIDFVRDNAKIPIIETGKGVVHMYYDHTANRDLALTIINNSKTWSVNSHNALECLIVHSSRLSDLFTLFNPLADARVTVYADERSKNALHGRYPSDLLKHADENSYGAEFLDYKMAVKTVDNIEEALEHIQQFGSRYCEAIISEDLENIALFLRRVDAVAINVNASTALTERINLGKRTEIGISAQKLHVRGIIGLNQLITYKWEIRGKGTQSFSI